MNRILKITLLTSFLVLAVGAQALNVVFRFDDPYPTPTELDWRVVRLFSEKDIPLTLAMIPCDSVENPVSATDSAYVSFLRNGKFEIALHGLTHQHFGNGEFGDLDADETARRIRNGLKIIELEMGGAICTFVPPFNMINAYTLPALREEGITCFSGDMFAHDYFAGIDYYVETLGFQIGKKGMWNAAEEAIKANEKTDRLCVVMFHAYDLETEEQWARLTALLDYCRNNPNIHTYTFKELQDQGIHVDKRQYRANQITDPLLRYVHPEGVMYSAWSCYMYHGLFSFLMMLLAVGVAFVLSIVWKQKKMCLTEIVIGVGVFALAWMHAIGPKKLVLLCVVVLLVLIIVAFSLKKREIP